MEFEKLQLWAGFYQRFDLRRVGLTMARCDEGHKHRDNEALTWSAASSELESEQAMSRNLALMTPCIQWKRRGGCP